MSSDIDLKRLQKDVQYLMDRTAIRDCISRHSRGHDRHDDNILTAVYHDDGLDQHGAAVSSGPEYAAWMNPVHAAGSQAHTHNLTTHTCEIDRNTAHAESYVLVCLLNHDASPPVSSAGVISTAWRSGMGRGESRSAVRRSN
jgi:SnoaL-like domain